MKRKPAMLVVMLIGCSASFVPDSRGSEALLYAVNTDADTSIFSYEVGAHDQCVVFSDAGSDFKLMSRGGARDSAYVIRMAGDRLFAIGREKAGGRRAGAIYELHLDGSNRRRKITEVQSEEPLEHIAVDGSAQRIAYASRRPDENWHGEGAAHRVSAILVHNVESGAVLEEIDLLPRARFSLVSYLGWSRTGDSLYARLTDNTRRERLYAATPGRPLEDVPLSLDPLKKLIGQSARGEFVFTSLQSADLLFEDGRGRAVRRARLSGERRGWHHELSADDQLVALQTLSGELWIEDLRSGRERMVPLQRRGHLSLIGWAAPPGRRAGKSAATTRLFCPEK